MTITALIYLTIHILAIIAIIIIIISCFTTRSHVNIFGEWLYFFFILFLFQLNLCHWVSEYQGDFDLSYEDCWSAKYQWVQCLDVSSTI